jgi:hypothetical protein
MLGGSSLRSVSASLRRAPLRLRALSFDVGRNCNYQRVEHFCLRLSVWNPGKSARVFSRSSTCRSVRVFHCTHPAKHPHQTAARPSCDRAFCETQRYRTLLARCDGSSRRCHWLALATAPPSDIAAQTFQVIHPFHPCHGRRGQHAERLKR